MSYVLDSLRKRPGMVEDRIGNTPISIEVSTDGEVTAVRNTSGDKVPHMFVYWYAWQVFHPDTKVSGN